MILYRCRGMEVIVSRFSTRGGAPAISLRVTEPGGWFA